MYIIHLTYYDKSCVYIFHNIIYLYKNRLKWFYVLSSTIHLVRIPYYKNTRGLDVEKGIYSPYFSPKFQY